MNDRIQLLKQNIRFLNEQGVRKTYLYEFAGKSLRQTAGEPTQIRRAKLFAYILNHVPTPVLPYELIAGTMTGMCPLWEGMITKEEQLKKAREAVEALIEKKKDAAFDGALKFEEGKAKSFEDDFTSKSSRWVLMSRVHHDASITFEDFQQLIALMEDEYRDNQQVEKYEIARELERCFKIPYNQQDKDALQELPWFVGNHLNLNYGRIVKEGVGNTIVTIEDKLNSETDPSKLEFYEAARIAMEAVTVYISRYETVLRQQADNTEVSEMRRAELRQMAEVCGVIKTAPASGFREAVQLVWMLHVIASVGGGSALSFGRLDQYLFPYYKKDLDAGVLTKEAAKELLCCVWLKINEPKMRTVQSLTLGGVKPDGSDAANELTQLCLEITATVAMPYPNVGLRVHPGSPDWVYEEAMKSIKAGSGQPMLLNDDIWITNMQALGYEPEAARDYYNMGCVEIMIPGKLPNWGVTEAIAFPILIEKTMNRIEQGQIEVPTFDSFMKLYFEELDAAVDGDYQEAMAKKRNMEAVCYDPYSSVLIDGCLEKGVDMLQGGSEYPAHWAVYAYGIGTAADSLCAIKKHVYEQSKLTLKQLNEILKHNYDSAEEIRSMLEQETPAYGNGVEEVDRIADQVLSYFSNSVYKLNHGIDKDKFVSTLFGYFFHIYHGEIAGATPDGRYKGEPFSDSMGPGQGKDVKGPTRLLNSVLRLNQEYITGGYALNFKVAPSLIKSSEGTRKVIDLIRTYVKHGGPQIQLYTTNEADMRDAQLHPEKHKDLIVRVGGYCEYFINLDASLQNEIIERTTYAS